MHPKVRGKIPLVKFRKAMSIESQACLIKPFAQGIQANT
jgi:hypothetical protein